jgi:cytochrome c biogenesis protein CcmG/thiol:disulfide interchange protein DsbE
MRKFMIGTFFWVIGFASTPLLAAEVIDQDAFSVARYAQAKVVYLDFWASWCVPCRRSFPWLNEMQEKYGKEGLVIVGVNVDPERADADKFLQSYPAEFDLVMDPGGVLAEQWRLQGMPSAVLVSPSGEELHRHVGFRENRQAEYEAILQTLLRGQEEVE